MTISSSPVTDEEQANLEEKKLASYFQIYSERSHSLNYCYCFLFAPRSYGQDYFLLSFRFFLFSFHHSFSTSFLSFFAICIVTIRPIICSHLSKLFRKLFSHPLLTSLNIRIVFTKLPM